jgi:nucleoid-associated protein YgaU
MTEGNGMTSTRNYLATGRQRGTDQAVVRLHPGRSRDEAFDDLPVAVGFGSPVAVRPRRLCVVPGLPVEFVGAPGPRHRGRVIALPVGGVIDLGGAGRLTDPADGRPGSAAPAGTRAAPGRSSAAESVPLRLTARGRAVLLIVAAVIGLAVVTSAWFGASASTPPARSTEPAQVVVHNGDTLWSIATRIGPGRDPRAVVDQLVRVNHLDTPALVPGQVLSTH